MNTSIRQASRIRSTGLKVVAALGFVLAMGGLSISPAIADKDGGHGMNNRHDDHGRRGERGMRDRRGYWPAYRQPYGYAQPVYIPPPVYYEPQQSPGISLFFPLDLRR